MGKSSDAAKQQVTQYNASIHFGICSGPVDYISGIYVNENEAWAGEQSVQGSITISDKMELFGGDKKEGGVQGIVEYLPGDDAQTIPELLAGKVGLTTATMPAYRGITSAWFYGRNLVEPDDEGLGFYWTANSPYLPGVWIKVARASTALAELHARIYRGDGGVQSVRAISGFGSGPSFNDRDLFDFNAGHIARFNADLSQLISEDEITGENYFSIAFSDTPRWILISADREEIIVKADSGVYVYHWEVGTLKQTITGLPYMAYPTLSGPPSKEIEREDEGQEIRAFFFKNNTSMISFVAVNGGAWSAVDQEVGWGLGTNGGMCTASETYVVNTTPSGSTSRWNWSVSGVSGRVTVDTDGGGDFNAVIWLGTSDVWVFFQATRMLTLNSDLTSITNDSSEVFASNFVQHAPLLARHGAMDGVSRVTGVTGPYNEPNDWGHVSIGDGLTGEVISSVSLLDWGFEEDLTAGSYLDAGYDDTTGAWVLHDGDGDAWVLIPIGGPFDSNPSHIIYDSLTNTDWGMGAPASAIDADSFTSAAATLYEEGFGLSMIWTKQATIEAFISEILDHIEATLYVSPFTGLLTLKLIRNDYSITGLPEFTPDNSVVTNWQRKLWGETVNEVVVSWTNPINEETETVVAQDLANIEAQGGIVSDGRNYYGVRVKDLAMRLAQRDLRAASTPLASCDIEVNREAWSLVPGDVVILNSPEDDIDSIVMRVGPVDYGKPGDPTVKASLVEDVWALPLADYTVPPDTLAEDTAEEPSPADDTLIFTLPYFVTVNKIPAATLSDVEYPEVFTGVLASEDGSDTSEFELLGEVTDAGGNVAFANIGTKNIASRGTLPDAIDAGVETTIVSFPDRTQGHGPRIGGFMLIEGDDETEHELCLVTAWDGSPTAYTFLRGVLDTVPRAWPAGTPVWFFDQAMAFTDATIRSESETVDYKVLIRTSLGLLPEEGAPISSETLTARPHLPLRPADVTVNSDDGFGGILDLAAVDPIPTAWARRNRLTEDAIVLAWDAADVTPEAGQTTTVRLTDLAGNMLHEYTGIAGTSQDVDPADFGTEAEGYIEFVAVRDSLESLMGHRVRVLIAGSLFEFEDGASYEFEDDEPKIFED